MRQLVRSGSHLEKPIGVFLKIYPASTFMEVSAFIDPEWLVEREMDAVVSEK